MSKIKCKICNENFLNNHSLSMHLKRKHDISCEAYYIKYINANNLCIICKTNKCNFINLSKGFNKTCSLKCGHEHRRITNMKKYGFEIASQSQQVIKTMEETNKDLYGVTSLLCSTLFKEQSMTKKYGVSNPNKITNFKLKSKKTCLIKYGTEYALQNSYVRSKGIETKRKNKTLNTSKIENKIYEHLISLFPNTKRNYKSELYPFLCDFYIPDKDLYIELNAHWTHGSEAFNPNNISHLIKKVKWKRKKSKFYDEAIKTWTQRDVKKRFVAKQNSLNYLEIFSKDENKIKIILGENTNAFNF